MTYKKKTPALHSRSIQQTGYDTSDTVLSGSTGTSTEDAFLAAMRAAGVPPAGAPQIVADGKLQRFQVDGHARGSVNGWYVLHGDNLPAGAFGDWKTGKGGKWCAKGTSEFSAEERSQYTARMDAIRATQEAERERSQAEARQAAGKVWDNAPEAKQDHPYLARKVVPPLGIREESDGRLLVPLRDASGTLHSLQRIRPDGEKRFFPGGRVKGCFHTIQGDTKTVYVAEGYATGATVHEATGATALCAMACGNLKAVAATAASLFPLAVRVIAADNDPRTEGNPGLTKGREAARATGAGLAFPRFDNDEEGSDFNDLHASRGAAAVAIDLANVENQWPELGNLQAEDTPMDPFPVDCLPSVMAEHAKQVAASVQVPPEFPACCALALAGFSMGNRTYAELKPGLKIRANTFWMIVMGSGERKSTTFGPMTRALGMFAESHADEWARTERDGRIYRAKVEKLEKELVKTDDSHESSALRYQIDQMEEPRGTCKSFQADDVTEEALAKKLATCGGRGAVFSGEGRKVIDQITGRYRTSGNGDGPYLKGYDGDPIIRTRVGDGESFIINPSVGMLVLVQPDKLREIGANDALRHSGFVARLNFVLPPSLVGHRMWTETGIDASIQEAYDDAILARLAKFSDQTEDCIVRLEPDAKSAWIDWYNGIEQEMAPGEMLGKHADSAARWQSLPVRLALTLAEYNDHESIALDDMSRAIEIAAHLVEHGRRAAEIAGMGRRDNPLFRAVKHLKEKDNRTFVPSDLQKYMRASAPDVLLYIGELERRGYLRARGTTRGRKNAPEYDVNPEVFTAPIASLELLAGQTPDR